MKNFVQKGDILTVIAPAAVTGGVPFVLGAQFLVPVADAARDALVACHTEGVYNLPLDTAADVTAGQIAYWDDTAKEIVAASAAGRFIIGTIVDAQARTDGFCLVRLNGIHVVAI